MSNKMHEPHTQTQELLIDKVAAENITKVDANWQSTLDNDSNKSKMKGLFQNQKNVSGESAYWRQEVDRLCMPNTELTNSRQER